MHDYAIGIHVIHVITPSESTVPILHVSDRSVQCAIGTTNPETTVHIIYIYI